MDEKQEKKNLKIGITDCILLILSLVFLVGMLLFFGPCKGTADHGFMSCHYAGIALKVYAAVLLCDSLLHFLPFRGIKIGISTSMLPLSIAAILTPGTFIPLCMMKDMRCHAVMQPADMILAMFLIAAAVADIILQAFHIRKENRK